MKASEAAPRTGWKKPTWLILPVLRSTLRNRVPCSYQAAATSRFWPSSALRWVNQWPEQPISLIAGSPFV